MRSIRSLRIKKYTNCGNASIGVFGFSYQHQYRGEMQRKELNIYVVLLISIAVYYSVSKCIHTINTLIENHSVGVHQYYGTHCLILNEIFTLLTL